MLARYEVAGDTQEQSLKDLADSLGAEYDYVSLLGFVFRRFWRRMKNPLDNSKKLICSEAVAKFLKGIGYTEFDEPETWTPQDVLEFAQRHQDRFSLVEGS